MGQPCEYQVRSQLRLPDGVLQMTPAAGDVLIVPEATSHCVLPWQPADRARRVVLTRYNSGASYADRLARAYEGRTVILCCHLLSFIVIPCAK